VYAAHTRKPTRPSDAVLDRQREERERNAAAALAVVVSAVTTSDKTAGLCVLPSATATPSITGALGVDAAATLPPGIDVESGKVQHVRAFLLRMDTRLPRHLDAQAVLSLLVTDGCALPSSTSAFLSEDGHWRVVFSLQSERDAAFASHQGRVRSGFLLQLSTEEIDDDYVPERKEESTEPSAADPSDEDASEDDPVMTSMEMSECVEKLKAKLSEILLVLVMRDVRRNIAKVCELQFSRRKEEAKACSLDQRTHDLSLSLSLSLFSLNVSLSLCPTLVFSLPLSI
jgi:hypothetical protein